MIAALAVLVTTLPALGTLTLGAPPPTTPVQLGLCQMLESGAACDVHTAWEIDKRVSQTLLANPHQAPVTYTIRVVEGATHYALALTSHLTLTGLVPAGTRVLGLVAGLQRGDDDGFTTIASGAAGDIGSLCDCPYVGGADLDVQALVAGSSGAVGDGTLIEYLGLGEHTIIAVDTRYDLSPGIVQAGDALRLQVCVSFEPVEARDGELVGLCRDEGGSIRTARACSALDLGTLLPAASATVHDVLGALPPWLAVSGLTPGVPRTFEVVPSGVAGTVHSFAIDTVMTCADELSCVGGVCTATIDNVALLAAESATASLVVTCTTDQCAHIASCDDGDPCTIDECQPDCGCVHVRSDAPECRCSCPDDEAPDDDDDIPVSGSGSLTPGDSDGDGLLDLVEDPAGDGRDAHETSALDPDSDGDGLCDGHVVVPPCVGVEDTDGDGDVFDHGRDEPSPLDPDSDDDGICDGEWAGGECLGGEMAQGTDPLDSDSDDDGLCDGPGGDSWDRSGCLGSEVGEDGLYQSHDTDPADPDSDDDGLCDGFLNGSTACRGAEDADGDGALGADETDPLDPDSDGGGVPDGVEVLIQHSDPRDACDGDTFLCGPDLADPDGHTDIEPDRDGNTDIDSDSDDADSSDDSLESDACLGEVCPELRMLAEGGSCASQSDISSLAGWLALLLLVGRRPRERTR